MGRFLIYDDLIGFESNLASILLKTILSHLRIKTAGNVVAIQLDTSTTRIPKSVNAILSTHVTTHVSITTQDRVFT